MINKLEISSKAAHIRKQLGEDADSPIELFTLVHDIPRLTVVVYPLGKRISGACMRGESSSVIAINSSMTRGRQRFSLAHELYHLYFDTHMTSSVCTVAIGRGNIREQEADQFASFLLIPPSALYARIEKMQQEGSGKLTSAEVVQLEQHFQVSRQAMLYRLGEDGYVTPGESMPLQQNVISGALKLGYDTSLYRPLPENKQARTYGYYIRKAEALLSSSRISNGKYEQFLLEAFRDDIVFGDDQHEGEQID